MPQRYEFALSLPPVPSVQGVPKKQIPLARNFSGSFEDEHDEDEEDASAEALAKEDLVADFGALGSGAGWRGSPGQFLSGNTSNGLYTGIW